MSDERPGYVEINNTFDNIINLTKAKGALEKVSVRLLALNLVSGDEKKDNLYITADNYRELQSIIPEDVRNLIDITSMNSSNFNYALASDYFMFFDGNAYRQYQPFDKELNLEYSYDVARYFKHAGVKIDFFISDKSL